MSQTTRYAIGLGSNLGDRISHLQGALAELARLGTVTAVSGLYETDPVGGPSQDPYLNAVAVLDSDLAPRQLLGALHEVESAAGRARNLKWGPRTLDLDILVSTGPAVSEEDLVIPHPLAARREFVLRPLVDVWPDAEFAQGLTAADALTDLTQGVDLVARRWAGGLSDLAGKVFVAAQMVWFLAVGLALAWDGSLPEGEAVPLRIVGAAMTVIGAGMAFVSLRRLGPGMTALPEPKQEGVFVESGPYRLVRHPIYGGVFLWLLGTSLFLDSVVGTVLSLGLLGFFYLKSQYEERRLRIAYPEYSSYRRRVNRRLIPFLF